MEPPDDLECDLVLCCQRFFQRKENNAAGGAGDLCLYLCRERVKDHAQFLTILHFLARLHKAAENAACRGEHAAMANDDSCPMKPARILADVRKVMGRADILVSDVGAHKMWIARHYDCYEPNTCLISNGFASMGFSIPGAFAAKLLNPDKKVLAVCGDGGFMMNSQELETAVRENVPFVTLIWEDSSYGLIKWKEQEQFGGEHCYVDFSNPDFKLLAEAMHCKGYRVEKAADLIPTLEEAFRQTVPSVIVVPVDYSENMKLSAHLKEVYQQS